MKTEKKSICFAYYVDGKFIGWYADSFGSVRPAPKLYSDLEAMRPIITKNLSYKLKKVNESSFEQAKTQTKNVIQAIGLATYDSEEVLRGKQVELRVVECPIYDGPNPDFDEEAHDKKIAERKELMTKLGIFDIPGPSMERYKAVEAFNANYPHPSCDNWIYADYKLVKEWAATEPTTFIGVIKPE